VENRNGLIVDNGVWEATGTAEGYAARGIAVTTRQEGYTLSQKKRKRIEECLGWLKTIALMRKVRHRGTLKVDWIFTFARGLQSGAHEEPDAQHSSDVARAVLSLRYVETAL